MIALIPAVTGDALDFKAAYGMGFRAVIPMIDIQRFDRIIRRIYYG